MISLWDTAAAKEIRQLKKPQTLAFALAFSPDGKTLASGDSVGMVRLWDPATGKEIRQLKGHQLPVHAVVFSPDGKTLASGGYDKTIRLWDTAAGKEIRQLEIRQLNGQQPPNGFPQWATVLSFSLDGKTLASGGDEKTIRLWETATGKEIRQFNGHGGSIHALVFSPDGKTLASGSKDATILIWDIVSPRAK